ncbi:hypothetical protein [Achromobacter sp.]|uniref:hypothetical protein n=1 Tax=Achromobacter sp. TaxID=134375 RepID=UPI003C75D7C1
MPVGPDYPCDQSEKYSLEARNSIRYSPAADNIQGLFLTPEGDLRTWLIASYVQDSHRDLITALAYLDVADRAAADRSAREAQQSATLHAEISDLRNEVRQLRDTVQASAQLVQALVSSLGVIVPAWHTRKEIEEGDDMGLTMPSAKSAGLVIEIIALQREPGFGHEEIVSMEPEAGTLVARGSTVRVRMNFMG